MAFSISSNLSVSVPVSEVSACWIRPWASVTSPMPFFKAVSMAASFVSRSVVWPLMALSMVAIFAANEPFSDSMAFLMSSCADLSSVTFSASAASIRSSFASRLTVWLVTAVWMAASFSSRVPSRESRAVWIISCCAFASVNPSLTAASIRPSFVDRSAVWLLMAETTAAILSSSVPPNDSRAVRMRSCAVALSARPSFTAASTRPIFVSRQVVCAFTASSMAANFSSTEPSSASTACSSSSCCACPSAKPSWTAASISASFISKLAVWAVTVASMAASFCSVVPEREARAERTNSCAAWLSAKPSFMADSIKDSCSSKVVLICIMASTIPSNFIRMVRSTSGCSFWQDVKAVGATKASSIKPPNKLNRLRLVVFERFMAWKIIW